MDLNADHSKRVVVDASTTLQGQGSVSLERHGLSDHAQISVMVHPAGEAWSHVGEQLLEILVVLAIIGLLAGLAISNVDKSGEVGNAKLAISVGERNPTEARRRKS